MDVTNANSPFKYKKIQENWKKRKIESLQIKYQLILAMKQIAVGHIIRNRKILGPYWSKW